MRIAVTYENGQVFQHFGRSERFKFYDVENGEIVSSQVVGTNGAGHGALAGFLKEAGVDVAICGGVGQGMRNALASLGVALYPGNEGSADEAVARYLAGELDPNAAGSCGCGDHACK